MSAQAALNDRDFLRKLAAKGEGGDDHIAHVGTGDTVFPVEKIRGNPEVQRLLSKAFKIARLNPGQFVVGHKDNLTNKATGALKFDSESGSGGGSDGGGGGGSDGGGGGGSDGGGGGGSDGGGGGGSDGGGGSGGVPGDTAGGFSGSTSATGKSISDALLGVDLSTSTPANIAGKAIAGAIPGIGTAASMLGAVDTAAKHGVDQPGNPGGNTPSSATGGVGNVTGIGTDPGGVGVGNPGGLGAGDTTPDQVAKLLGASVVPPAAPPTSPVKPLNVPTATAPAAPAVAPAAVPAAPAVAPAAVPAAISPAQRSQIDAYKQNLNSTLYNSLAAQGVNPNLDSRYISGRQKNDQMTDAEVLKFLGL